MHGAPVTLPDGSKVDRLPDFRRWLVAAPLGLCIGQRRVMLRKRSAFVDH